jgi:5-methylcytosine-specific restriction protein A
MARPCLKCGTQSDKTYCDPCYQAKKRKKMGDRRYSTQRWQKLRAQAIQRDNGCSISGCHRGNLHADHIIEVKDGGAFWDINNLQVLCKEHHDAKTLTVKAGRAEPLSPNR